MLDCAYDSGSGSDSDSDSDFDVDISEVDLPFDDILGQVKGAARNLKLIFKQSLYDGDKRTYIYKPLISCLESGSFPTGFQLTVPLFEDENSYKAFIPSICAAI